MLELANQDLSKKLESFIIKNSLIVENFMMSKRPTTSSPSKVGNLKFTVNKLLELENCNFDIFQFSKVFGRDNLMTLVSLYVFENTLLNKYFSIEKLPMFLKKTRKKYKNNFYHNVHIIKNYLFIFHPNSLYCYRKEYILGSKFYDFLC